MQLLFRSCYFFIYVPYSIILTDFRIRLKSWSIHDTVFGESSRKVMDQIKMPCISSHFFYKGFLPLAVKQG